jgi:hypothetical protein
MITIGIDNGSTGSVGIVGWGNPVFFNMPTKEAVHYAKSGKIFKRVDVAELCFELRRVPHPVTAFIERPFTGSPMMINAALLAARAHEAVMIALEQLGIGYQTIDSKAWQSALISGVKGSPNLKKASRLKGIQLYPQLADYINHNGDADGLLIAHHYANL